MIINKIKPTKTEENQRGVAGFHGVSARVQHLIAQCKGKFASQKFARGENELKNHKFGSQKDRKFQVIDLILTCLTKSNHNSCRNCQHSPNPVDEHSLTFTPFSAQTGRETAVVSDHRTSSSQSIKIARLVVENRPSRNMDNFIKLIIS